VSSLGLDRNALVGALLASKYRLTRRIGQGAHGAVYEAEHAELGRRVAIKLLHSGEDSERARQRFAREARLLARLEHENIVALIDAGNDETLGQYLVLEFIRGSTLREALPSFTTAPVKRVADIVRQIACGLGHAHASGVVHRDLKPENVMLTSHADGQPLVKLLDFGVARLCDTDEASLTVSGTALGTAAYMAPEQARGERDVDHRVDVYALGVMLYELLSGTRPFTGTSYNETLFQVLTKPHVPLQSVRPDLSADFCAVVERALQKEREHRFDQVEDLSRSLTKALRQLEQPSASELATSELTLETITLPKSTSTSPPKAPTARNGLLPLLFAGSVSVSLALGVALGWSFEPRGEPKPEPSVTLPAIRPSAATPINVTPSVSAGATAAPSVAVPPSSATATTTQRVRSRTPVKPASSAPGVPSAASRRDRGF